MINKVFWTLVIFEGAAILPMLIKALFFVDRKEHDYPVYLAFALIPTISLGVVALLYRNTKSPVIHGVLLVVPLLITLPFINMIRNRIGGSVAAYETAYGIGLFKDPGVSALLKAIGMRDEAQVRKLAQTVDVNAVAPAEWLHPSPYTPIRFAVERAVVAEDKGEYVYEFRRMVEVLLSLGAKPSPGLIYACGSSRTDLTRMLLDAGADANHETVSLQFGNQTTRDLPFYACAESAESALGNLELLASHGARFKVLVERTAWPMRSAILHYRWDQALFLYDHGLPMETDRAMREVVEEAVRKAGEPDDQLSRVRQLVNEDPREETP